MKIFCAHSSLNPAEISYLISQNFQLGLKCVKVFLRTLKVTVDLRGVFWVKQYSALCINGKYIYLYIIGELISLATRLC